MYTVTFTCARREFDDAFHALDQVIAQVLDSCGDGRIPHPLGHPPAQATPSNPDT
ncbi:MAG: hypothetical protein ACOYLV_02340 [Rubrivivax sp.]